MPINDSSSVYPEKLIKSTTATSAPKSNPQLDLQLLLNPSSSSVKLVDNSLIKYQGQKWHQLLDFEKMLKQIRVTEKQNLRNKSDHSTGGGSSSSNSTNNNGKSSTQPNVAAVSPPKTTSLKCSRQLKQVQCLSGGDMHYYGIVPKQTAIGVVVCNVCKGIYTRVGFNNHMMLQHPSVWSTISTKMTSPTTNTVDSCSNLTANDNSQDSVRPDSVTNTATADIVIGSPSDLSGTMSTCSNASSNSSSLSAATYATAAAIAATPTTTPRHHKSSKNSSSAGGSSSGGNGSRSRSKSSKHHQSLPNNSGGVHASSTSTSSSVSTTGATGTEVSQTSSKTTKKSSNTNASTITITTSPITLSSPITTTAVAAPPKPASIGGASTTTATMSIATTSADTHTQPITIYSSSSSNSSCSLPLTPKMVAISGVPDVCTLSAPLEKNAFSPVSLISLNDPKDKTSTDASASVAFIASSKKKSKSPLFIGQESVDSSTSNSSSEYERASSSGTNTSSKSANAASFTSNSKTNNISVSIKLPMCGKDLKRFSDTHISELDQAVSSITVGTPNTKNGITTSICMEDIESDLGANTTFKMHQPPTMDETVIPPTTVASGSLITASYQQQQELGQACDEHMPHNTSDDNSILALEDMLDSKFINEILNTADSEIHFDENELDATTQQHATYSQQPVAKRMRFDESVTNGSMGSHQTEISGEFAVFQQQQQQMLQQQQYAHYDAENLEDIKVYNAEQLQQLLYQQQQQQQQNLNGYGSVDGIDGSTVSTAFGQQEQFGPNDSIVNVNAKQIIDLCAEEDLQKSKGILQGNLADYTSMTPMNVDEYGNHSCNALAAQFHIFNVPSLTDDTTEEDANNVMPSIVDNGRTGVGATQQYVLPGSEDHLIYEITANNQVAVMSQQRQQQVIAEFLTQAGYENVESNMHGAATLTSSATTTTDDSSKYSMWDDDLLDFDFSCIETAKSLSGTNLNTSGGGGGSIKCEQYKYQDDYYFNILFYAGVPRPLAINCFGLIKLPHASATTFRKNLLTTRKANNSPISLSGAGGINGVVGGSNVGASAASRLTGINSKSVPNYFTQLSSSGGNPNEFSIGSITITNSPTSATMSPHQVYAQQQKQQQQVSGSVGGSSEITFNAAHNTNGSATSPVSSVLHRVRAKVNAGNATNALGNNNIASVGGVGKNKSLMTLTTTGGGVAANARTTIRPNYQQNSMLPQQNTKTIYVSKTANTNSNVLNERVKFVKRGLIAKVDILKSKPKLSPKNIADILGLSIAGGGCKSNSGGAGSNKQQQHQSSADNSQDALQNAEEQIKSNRVNRFYERRRKLLTLANNSRQQQHQLQQKLLQKPQLFRNLSDCSVNSISSHCKNNNNNPNGNSSNDIVRVFV